LSGYWTSTEFLKYVKEHEDEIKAGNPIDFYDSVTGKLLFQAPVGRSLEDFLAESKSHGWPSFRDEETNWEYVRCLKNGECISESGTHLGHNLPDSKGNRYCINLVSVAGQPEE
jgi:peptide methionine sulfoxide reductase MsrB